MTKEMQINVQLADSSALQAKAFTIREEVFVVEQKVPKEEEFDEFEVISRHFVVLDEHGNPIGAARWRRTEKGVKLERFVVKMNKRGQGIGQALVAAVLEDISRSAPNGSYLYMHAQLDAVGLYEKFGFKKVGEIFDECNILHYKMEKRS